jgi:hypothetical protein
VDETVAETAAGTPQGTGAQAGDPAATTAGRHPFDAFGLVLGLLCLVGSGLALAAQADVVEVDGLVAIAAIWLVVGVAGLARGLQRLLGGKRAQL